MKSDRSSDCLKKIGRMKKVLSHEEPDRVPVSDFFWQGFVDKWRDEKKLSSEFDINRYYDFDYVVTMPNTDPHIKSFEILERNDDEIVVRTGFEAVISRAHGRQMPVWLEFGTDTIQKAQQFQFDDPGDERRFFSSGDHQIAGIEEAFQLNIPPWLETVESYYTDFPVYGSLPEGYETLWRIVGSENALLWIAQYPEEIGEFIRRINEFCLELAKQQISAVDGRLDGMILWGDVAYNNGMLFSPAYWRKYFKPGVRAIIDACHECGIPVIYHGCGDVQEIFQDFIEIGADAYNPLQVNAGMDAVELRRKYGHTIALSGNMGVIDWAEMSLEELKATVLHKLNAAKGGGYIFQSDNSIPDTVSVERYEYVLGLVREYGRFPLNLGAYDLADIS